MKPLRATLLLLSLAVCGCSMDETMQQASAGTKRIARNVGRTVNKSAKQTSRALGQAVTWVKEKASPHQHEVASSHGRRATDRYHASGKAAPRYIAVDAPHGPDSPSGPERQTVMIYDTKKGEVLGNNAFDVDRKPSPGEALSIDGKNVEYVGK